MSRLPASAPASAGAAFAHINAVVDPTIDDLKLMVFLEASGQVGYEALARSTTNAEISALLMANAREEMDHAVRVSEVIKRLTGEDFPPPPPAENPYAQAPGRPLDRQVLTHLIAAEDHGGDLYDAWATHTADPEAAALLRQNGKEERLHGERAAKALSLLEA